MKRVFISTNLSRLLGLAVLVLILAACGGGDLDETSPLLTFNGVMVNGVPSAVTTTPTRTLSGTAEAGSTIEISIDGTDILATGISVPATGDWSSDIRLQPGAHLVTVSAFDAAGNQGLFSLTMTYDAVSIETYTTPIPVDNLLVGGLVDDDNYTSPLIVTVTPTDTAFAPFTVEATVNGDNTWSANLSDLATGANEVKVSSSIAGVTDPNPVEALVTITVDDEAPVVSIDQPLSFATLTVPSQTLTGTTDPAATSLTTLPLSAGTPIVDSGAWSASIEGLSVGKNPITATVSANGKSATIRTLLFVEQAPPLVNSISPAQGAVAVASDVVVSAVFNTEMNMATIDTDSFTLNGGAIDATVSYDEATKTATLMPKSSLTSGTTYTAELATTITDSADNPLKQALSWDFTVQ